MGAVAVGDYLLDDRGHVCRVTATSEIQYGHRCYEVIFEDGSTIVADENHKWLTFDLHERAALARRTPEYRARRRAHRESRGTGQHPDLAIANTLREYAYLERPAGSVRTTKEIWDTLKANGRTNHSVPVCGALDLPERELPVPPYVLGAWLGDGSSYKAEITTADREILDEIEHHYRISKRTDITYGIYGLLTDLKALGLIGNKHIPGIYLRASIDQRLELLQGLMDTDGYCDTSGQCEFTTTNELLARDVHELLSSLGIKVTITEGRTRLFGKDCGPKYRLKFLTEYPAFKLERKLRRQKRNGFRGTHRNRYIVEVKRVKSVPVKCVAVDSPSRLYLAGLSMIPTHNTDLVIGMAVECHQHSAIFRRVYPNLQGIMRRAREIIGTHGKENKTDKIWTFPDGRTIEFGAVQFEDDKKNWQGRPHDLKAFDEITEFSESQYEFICGWNRTTDPGQRVRVIATGNPPLDESGSWVVKRWGAWLDPAHPNPAKPGELRWYATVKGQEREFPNGDPVEIDGETIYPRSRTFIPARLEDNVYLASDQRYRSVIQSLPEPLRSMLLNGDFHAASRPDPFQVIPTEWVRAAQRRWMERPRPDVPLTAVGIDAVRGGDDKMTLARRYDNWYDDVKKWPGVQVPDGATAATLVHSELGDEEPGYVNVDVIGVGSSTFDHLKIIYPSVIPVNVSESSDYRDRSGKLKMRNLRAEMHWRMRDALDPIHGDDIALPNDPEVLADLCAARYKVTSAGVQIEDKEEIKARIGRSPDVGEAIMLANLPGKTKVDWDDLQGLGRIEDYQNRWT